MNKESKNNLKNLICDLTKKYKFELCSLNILTNTIPITIQISIKKNDESDITINDCSDFNEPLEVAIEDSGILNCSYVLEISSQGVSDELTSERDFITFKGFPINVELKQNTSNIKNLSGLLYARSKDYLAINIKGKIKKIPFIEVSKVSLATIEH